jgi:hypothetical protein
LENNTLVINENSFHYLKKIKFRLRGKLFELDITPYELDMKHLKLNTRGMSYAQILDLKNILESELEISEDVYFTSPVDRKKLLYFVLNNRKIENPYLGIISETIHYLTQCGIITPYFLNPHKICMNRHCRAWNQHYSFTEDICPHCRQVLVGMGSSVKIKFEYSTAKRWLKSSLTDRGFLNLGKVTKFFNRLKVDFYKFRSPGGKEFLIFFQDEQKRNLRDLAKRFVERNLPVLFITTRNDFLDIPELQTCAVGRIRFSDFLVDLEERNQIEFKKNLNFLELKYDTWKTKNFSESLETLSNFIRQNKDLELIERNTTMPSKGRAFERIINNIFKRICSSWIDLGQTKQNLSVPDGVGAFSVENQNFVFGFDAKLKKDQVRKKGLRPKEIRKQIEYIKDFRSKCRRYGGLKSWVIVVKSKDDCKDYLSSISKIEKETGFNKIIVFGVEHLIKISELYNYSIANKINPSIFLVFLKDVLNRKGILSNTRFNRLYENCKSRLIELVV